MNTKTSVLLVDDEASILATFAPAMRRAGYDVRTARNGLEALRQIEASTPDLLVLDMDMPAMTGSELIRRLRSEGYDLPIIVLSKYGGTEERALTLRAGASDYMSKPADLLATHSTEYLPKPFGLNELIARIENLLVRASCQPPNLRGPQSRTLVSGALCLDLRARTVHLAGTPVVLSAKSFELLEYLMHHPGVVLTRSELLAQVWKWDYFGGTRTVDTHIRRVRQALGDDVSNPTFIETVRPLGYRFLPEVKQIR